MTRRGPVLFVLPSLEVGGTEQHVARLAAACQQRGPGAVIVCTRADGPLGAEVRGAGVRVEVLGCQRPYDLRIAAGVARSVARLRPSAVHAFLSGFDVMATVPARALGVERVFGSRRELAWWMGRRHALVQAVGTVASHGIICCAEAVLAEALRREPAAAGKLQVIRNGVDLARFAPDAAGRQRGRQRFGLAAGELAVVTVANFDVEKGYDVLSATVRAVARRQPEARFLWAGDGPLRAGVEARASDLVRAGVVRLLGLVDDVSGLLAAADVFVLASRHEGLPNAVLEAMAAGLAIVATGAGGVPEVIDDASSGLLVPTGNAAALTDAILRVLGDGRLRARLGAGARAKAAAELDLAASIDAHLALYGAMPSAGHGVEARC